MKTPEEGYAMGWADAIYAYESKQRGNMDDLVQRLRERDALRADAEPVAWRAVFKLPIPAMEAGRTWNGGKPSEADIMYWTKHGTGIEYAYASPPKHKPLTDEQIDAIPFDGYSEAAARHRSEAECLRQFARAIERAHGIGDE